MNGTSPSSIVDLGTLGGNRSFVGSGDFDGDGRADLLLRSDTASRRIWFMNGDSVRKTVPLDGSRWLLVDRRCDR